MGGRYNQHESPNRDCLLILEQSERIGEFEEAMQMFNEYVFAVQDYAELLKNVNYFRARFKHILEKGK